MINAGVTVQGSGGNNSAAQIGAVGQIWANKGTITASATGADLTLAGQFYNEGTISSAAGTTVSLIGDSLVAGQPGWTNFGPTNNPGTIQVSGTLSLGGSWSNYAGGAPIIPGNIQVTGGTLNLGGQFHTADIGTITRSRGTVAITGALDNTGATLALDNTTGSWDMADGSVTGGTLQTSGAAQFLQPLSSFTLANITAFDGTWAMLGGNGGTTLVVRGDLNLNGAIDLSNNAALTFAGPAGTTQNINSVGTAVISLGSGRLPRASYSVHRQRHRFRRPDGGDQCRGDGAGQRRRRLVRADRRRGPNLGEQEHDHSVCRNQPDPGRAVLQRGHHQRRGGDHR